MQKRDYLDQLKNTALGIKDSVIVTILCNVAEETTDYENYTGDSITSEFLTAEQLNAMVSALRSVGFETNIYIDEDQFMRDVLGNQFYRVPGKHNIVLNSAQKGTSVGRKSLVPAFCDLQHICHSNSNAYIVSLCRDKFFSGKLVESLGFPCPDSWCYRYNSGWLRGLHPESGRKVIAKLNYETSSIGLGVENIFDFNLDVETFIHSLSQTYQQDIVVQAFIPGYEVEVPVVIGKQRFAIAPMGVYYRDLEPLGTGILDYEGRKAHTYHFADFHQVSAAIAEQLEQCAVETAASLGIQGLGRIDFRVTETDSIPYITDIATNPGIHRNTSIYQGFEDLGYTYQDMMTILVGLTISRYGLT
jgi:D-alanine-D-alanine ligase